VSWSCYHPFRVSAGRYEQIGQQFVEIYTEDQLRAFAIEQLEDYGITVHDVNEMKS
jgi:hypothetical protein